MRKAGSSRWTRLTRAKRLIPRFLLTLTAKTAREEAQPGVRLRFQFDLAGDSPIWELLEECRGLSKPWPFTPAQIARHGGLLGEDALRPLSGLGRSLPAGQ